MQSLNRTSHSTTQPVADPHGTMHPRHASVQVWPHAGALAALVVAFTDCDSPLDPALGTALGRAMGGGGAYGDAGDGQATTAVVGPGPVAVAPVGTPSSSRSRSSAYATRERSWPFVYRAVHSRQQRRLSSSGDAESSSMR